MDGYETTVLKASNRADQAVLWLVTSIIVGAPFIVCKDTEMLLPVIGVSFITALITICTSRSFSTAHLTWGPKGVCYSEGLIKRTISFKEIGALTSRVMLANKRNSAFIIVEDLGGREKFRINTALFDETDINTFVRCIENNTTARLTLAPMLELREKQDKRPFVVDTDHIKLTEPRR